MKYCFRCWATWYARKPLPDAIEDNGNEDLDWTAEGTQVEECANCGILTTNPYYPYNLLCHDPSESSCENPCCSVACLEVAILNLCVTPPRLGDRDTMVQVARVMLENLREDVANEGRLDIFHCTVCKRRKTSCTTHDLDELMLVWGASIEDAENHRNPICDSRHYGPPWPACKTTISL